MSSADSRRHWHGSPGARHEQVNVWTHGGSMGPASRAPWALTPEMMAAANNRRDSDSSSSSSGSNTNTNTKDTTNEGNASGASGSPPQTVSERRRSSNTSGARLFATLQTQKRESTDPSMVGRRASWNEQRQQGGFFGKLWDGFTRGK